jgi:hypothetical protein
MTSTEELLALQSDFDAGCQHMELLLQVKLSFWEQLPWHLAGLAHHQASLAQGCAQKCCALWDETPIGLLHLHHPVTELCLGPDGFSSDVAKMASGAPLVALSTAFQEQVACLKFIPIAERVIEAKHKDVKQRLAGIPRHSPALVSTAVRLLETRLKLQQDDLFLDRLATNLFAVRSPGKAALLFNFAGHPAMQALQVHGRGRPHAKVIYKTLGQVVYRSDLESQYVDLTGASKHHNTAWHSELDQVKKLQHRGCDALPLGLDAVRASVLGDHFQTLSTSEHVVFALPATLHNLPSFRPLGEFLASSCGGARPGGISPGTCLPIIPEHSSCSANQRPELPEGQGPGRGHATESKLFFRVVMSKRLGDLRQAPGLLVRTLRNFHIALLPYHVLS